jgi:hypothetical protein
MVAIEHDQTLFLVKKLKEMKNVTVGNANMLKLLIFPQFIAVAGLDIGIAVIKIIGQCILENMLVAGKLIGQLLSPRWLSEKKIRRDVSSNSRTRAF